MQFTVTSNFKILFAAVLITFTSTLTSFAQQSGLDFLTIGPNAKALGFNEAVTAELLGASSLYSNPANLAFENSSSLNVSYALWIGDLYYTNAGINLRKNNRALAFGFLSSQVDAFPLSNEIGAPEGPFTANSFSLSGGYAFRMGPVALGATLQYLREEYYIYNASGYAASLGASARFWDDRLHIGTSLLNLGEMTELRSESTPLPTTFRAGYDIELFTFTPPQNVELPVVVSLKNDVVFPLHSAKGTTQSHAAKDAYTNIALEFNIVDTISLRTGYKTGDNARHWSAGAGIFTNSFSVNYAIIPFETGFGTAHSIGLQYRF